MRYEHTQQARWTAAIALLALIAIVVTALTGSTDRLGGVWWYVMLVIVAIVLGWTSRLTVTIDDTAVTTTFGWGWPSRSVALTDVTAANRKRVRWYHGWGIRRVAGGWMYNTSGWDAVELKLRSDGVFWIGTDDPDGLIAALDVSNDARPGRTRRPGRGGRPVTP